MTSIIEIARRLCASDDADTIGNETPCKTLCAACLVLAEREFFAALRKGVMAQTSESRAYLAKHGD